VGVNFSDLLRGLEIAGQLLVSHTGFGSGKSENGWYLYVTLYYWQGIKSGVWRIRYIVGTKR
jgi:hypothetical protein